ncbi:hypothetical protein CSKR_105408 [Clonorchis sinensis]|uniref:Uncharacterized protein n=1 Tax=Clonorchis sinensis TaxID=79923 RepID=A0A419Q0R3_CLOSI|nr:hypothetical protein CSKR_105408 [Clonorchis sinensis]
MLFIRPTLVAPRMALNVTETSTILSSKNRSFSSGSTSKALLFPTYPLLTSTPVTKGGHKFSSVNDSDSINHSLIVDEVATRNELSPNQYFLLDDYPVKTFRSITPTLPVRAGKEQFEEANCRKRSNQRQSPAMSHSTELLERPVLEEGPVNKTRRKISTDRSCDPLEVLRDPKWPAIFTDQRLHQQWMQLQDIMQHFQLPRPFKPATCGQPHVTTKNSYSAGKKNKIMFAKLAQLPVLNQKPFSINSLTKNSISFGTNRLGGSVMNKSLQRPLCPHDQRKGLHAYVKCTNHRSPMVKAGNKQLRQLLDNTKNDENSIKNQKEQGGTDEKNEDHFLSSLPKRTRKEEKCSRQMEINSSTSVPNDQKRLIGSPGTNDVPIDLRSAVTTNSTADVFFASPEHSAIPIGDLRIPYPPPLLPWSLKSNSVALLQAHLKWLQKQMALFHKLHVPSNNYIVQNLDTSTRSDGPVITPSPHIRCPEFKSPQGQGYALLVSCSIGVYKAGYSY